MKIKLYFCSSCLISMISKASRRLTSSLCSSQRVVQFPRPIFAKTCKMMDLFRNSWGINFHLTKESISAKCSSGLEIAPSFHSFFLASIKSGKCSGKDYSSRRYISLCLSLKTSLWLQCITTQNRSSLCCKPKRFSVHHRNKFKLM
jgi:hypothetical protein